MNGAESILRTAANAGVTHCFANPGTTELDFMEALPRVSEIRSVLCAFEGVSSGAADGYGRFSSTPALTLNHLGPSFANGVANLHNARRAHTPIINLVGDHPTWHATADPPLASDIGALSRYVSGWTGTATDVGSGGALMAEAIVAACGAGGGVATMVVPADCQAGEGGRVAAVAAPVRWAPAASHAVSAAASALRAGGGTLLVGANALRGDGLRWANAIGRKLRCMVLVESFPARMDVRPGVGPIQRFPYVSEMARALLKQTKTLVLAGATEPVAYFSFAADDSRLTPPGVEVMTLATPAEDARGALEALATELGVNASEGARATPKPAPAGTALSPRNALAVLALEQPEDLVFIDEGVSNGGIYPQLVGDTASYSYLSLTGGAIGFGLPCSIGAALAAGGRKVVACVGDGSALYTLQALHTLAHERLDVVTIVWSNRRYRILELELERRRTSTEPVPTVLTRLGPPDVSWVALAQGFGVEAVAVDTLPAFREAVRRALSQSGPSLIEVAI